MDLSELVNELGSQIWKLGNERDVKISKINDEYAKKLERLRTALEVASEMNTVCTECRGKKDIRRMDGAGSMEWATCPRCNGTGEEPRVWIPT